MSKEDPWQISCGAKHFLDKRKGCSLLTTVVNVKYPEPWEHPHLCFLPSPPNLTASAQISFTVGLNSLGSLCSRFYSSKKPYSPATIDCGSMWCDTGYCWDFILSLHNETCTSLLPTFKIPQWKPGFRYFTKLLNHDHLSGRFKKKKLSCDKVSLSV